MNPKEILAIIMYAASQEECDRESIVAESIEAGVDSQTAEQAFNFIQIAWGRSFLGGLGITFSDLYYCFDTNGSFVRSGNLKDNLYFNLANSVADDYKGSSAFKYLALRSAELDAVNQALNNGSESHNLITAPVCIFLAPATAKGIEKAQNFVAEKLRRENPPQASSRSWWRF